MADQQLGSQSGVAACNIGGGTNRSNVNGGGTGAPQTGHWDTDYSDITALRARLTAIDAGFYTAARLNTLTFNDMVYAVRLADAPTTIR